MQNEDGDMIFISQQQYDNILHRIEQLQTAQDYNQQIIDRLIEKLQSLEQTYLATTRHQNSFKNGMNDSEDDTSMRS